MRLHRALSSAGRCKARPPLTACAAPFAMACTSWSGSRDSRRREDGHDQDIAAVGAGEDIGNRLPIQAGADQVAVAVANGWLGVPDSTRVSESTRSAGACPGAARGVDRKSVVE